MCIRDRINIAADLAGMADAAEMLSGINSHLLVVLFALLISWATVRLPYHQIANVLKWLVLVLFAYPITAFVVGADWDRVARATLVPSMPHTRDAVSYTHLDVYKRQLMDCVARIIAARCLRHVFCACTT